jgi:glucosamine--fructose-6-phosphate aminotransferase (isomerizing)
MKGDDMCGIVGYVGKSPVVPILINGLKRLEYRGYDSAGLALITENGLWKEKAVGRVFNLEKKVSQSPEATIGIAHTRWATHGGVTEENAHPHMDNDLRIAVVHNGIIENMNQIKKKLQEEGAIFRSETDTEVIPHLISKYYKKDPQEAVRRAVRDLRGTYGIVVAFADHPNKLIAARNGSPLVIGLGKNETVIASDPQAIVEHTRNVIYMNDREIAIIDAKNIVVNSLDGISVDSSVETIDNDYTVAELESNEHFMEKEIFEQVESIKRCIRGRLQTEEGNSKLGGLSLSSRDLSKISSVINIACGTSYHAGMVGAMAIEALARVPARAEVASEYRYRHPIIPANSVFFAISQSGETADTLGAVQEVQLKGGRVFGIINVVGSTIARTCEGGIYVHSGPEVAVASTKAFTSQVTAFLLFALNLARTKDMSLEDGQEFAQSLFDVPSLVTDYLDNPGPIDEAVKLITEYSKYTLFLGRGFSYPVALEGALKLKEIAYVPCEAYAAGEMKHGPIAMLEEGTPVIFIIPNDSHREKSISNLKEVQARGAKIIAVHTVGDEEVAELAHISIPVPQTHEIISPLLTSIPLQLISYKAGLALGRDIDKPRNLAKSVTVE